MSLASSAKNKRKPVGRKKEKAGGGIGGPLGGLIGGLLGGGGKKQKDDYYGGGGKDIRACFDRRECRYHLLGTNIVGRTIVGGSACDRFLLSSN